MVDKGKTAPSVTRPAEASTTGNETDLQKTLNDLTQQVRQLQSENEKLLKLQGTQKLQDNDRKSHLNRVKDDFISMVSHELRTPLTAIYGGVKLLSQGHISSDTEKGQTLLQVIAQNSQRLVSLVNDILDIEYLAAATDPLYRRIVNTKEITGPVSDTFRLLANNAKVELVVHDPGFEVLCDRDRLIQVLTNLLDNASKFSPPSATIQLSLQASELFPPDETHLNKTNSSRPAILFKVQDQGEGIPTAQLETVFERFNQIDSSNTRQTGGTGLGLALCRSIVEWHGGHIWAESNSGEGSCFLFTIPIR